MSISICLQTSHEDRARTAVGKLVNEGLSSNSAHTSTVSWCKESAQQVGKENVPPLTLTCGQDGNSKP